MTPEEHDKLVRQINLVLDHLHEVLQGARLESMIGEPIEDENLLIELVCDAVDWHTNMHSAEHAVDEYMKIKHDV